MKSSDMVVSDYLRKYLSDNVGDHVPDLIRLHAYTFTEYDAVALVDYDTLIVSPVDKVVDLILESSRRKEEEGRGDWELAIQEEEEEELEMRTSMTTMELASSSRGSTCRLWLIPKSASRRSTCPSS